MRQEKNGPQPSVSTVKSMFSDGLGGRRQENILHRRWLNMVVFIVGKVGDGDAYALAD